MRSGGGERAQRAGAVRPDVRTPDLIVLLKGLFASLAGISDPARRDLVFAVLADGLRVSRDTLPGVRMPPAP